MDNLLFISFYVGSLDRYHRLLLDTIYRAIYIEAKVELFQKVRKKCIANGQWSGIECIGITDQWMSFIGMIDWIMYPSWHESKKYHRTRNSTDFLAFNIENPKIPARAP